ncbi:MAG: hypothetical protein M1821_002170 [Bathelium mastoideum]|nr:MAG: hypothetical protein M1821_002170 [Bathelium mastoideum]KAI9685047.1 MAG: hypothetical protein M1822_005439 [Bathelium mastoideum]
MGPDRPLPLPEAFAAKPAEEFVDSLLSFATSSAMLQHLCGGVHVLDFFTRTPDLYSSLLPTEWREWFQGQDIGKILDLLLRKDFTPSSIHAHDENKDVQKDGDVPPQTLIQYIKDVRSHSLDRKVRAGEPSLYQPKQQNALSRKVAVGMKVKKIEEVSNFASYVDQLTQRLAAEHNVDITHLVDFGSGQNYLGRALASEPYNKHVIALESKPHNITGAKKYDEMARLTERTAMMTNKKLYRAERDGLLNISPELRPETSSAHTPVLTEGPTKPAQGQRGRESLKSRSIASKTLATETDKGSVEYLEFLIKDGNLRPVLEKVFGYSPTQTQASNRTGDHCSSLEPTGELKAFERVWPQLLVMSLHSCGNLVHHGIRSLLLNPNVAAVALVGCCYNLVTERLGPPTYKLPTLRTKHPRLEKTSSAFDPHGFPMSRRLCHYEHQHGRGIRLNITARMMAVQAPQNWGPSDSDGFFTRHFYRALLQRVFLDYGVVQGAKGSDDVAGGKRCENNDGSTSPVIIGSLRKSCYTSFVAYVRGALNKLSDGSSFGLLVEEKLGKISDEKICQYERDFKDKKHEISVMWSLMAFSAGVVEAIMVVDRWLFLREQECIRHCWVEPVFDYSCSPRNLVLVGVKKGV